MADNDRWNVNRFGSAARVTNPTRTVPQYGLVTDLATGTSPYLNTEQYQAMMRDIAAQGMSQALQGDPSVQQYQMEMEIAQNAQNLGYAMPNESFPNANDDDAGWFERQAGNVMTGVNLLKDRVSDAAASTVGLFEDGTDLPDPTYERYKLLGGILSRDDFGGFDEQTRQVLITRAEGRQTAGDIADTPGVSQALTGLGAVYHGAQTPFIIFGHAGHKNPLMNAVDPMWFKPGSWADAWREAHDQSFGNALVNSVAEPYVGTDRIDEWKRDSSLYDLTSMGVEIGAGWYADPLVLTGKAAGGAARFARYAAPINEQGRAFRATAQGLQREQITVRGPAGLYGRVQSSRMRNSWDNVKEYAQDRPFGQYAQLKMFQSRQAEGYSAAAATHWVFNEAPKSGVNLRDFANLASGERVSLNYPDLESLTQQLLHGDPKAWEDFGALKDAAPEELNKFAPGSQTYVDAIESIKTGLPSLQREADELAKVEPKSAFHNWSLHTEVDQRVKDIADQEDALAKYQGYDQWYDNMSREPKVQQVDARQRFFMDNQFGKTHTILKWAKPLWIQKANIASIHDVDSGAMSITRQFQQFEHLFGYRNPEALDHYLQQWIKAPTAHDRYQTMHSLEKSELVQAAAQKFKVEPEVIGAIYDKMVSEQNKVLAGIMRGDEPIYSSAPSAAQRAEAGGQNISLVNRDPDTGMVELNLMDQGRFTTVHVHESALAPSGPVDPTQTVNYYRPVDTRRFYYELKRNSDVIQTMNHVTAREGAAWLAEGMDWFGTKFNRMWKPTVLFRFGWPQRVLMDERMRALAVLGIPQFTRYYGSNDIHALNNATVRTVDALENRFDSMLHGAEWQKRTGRGKFNIGPGPLADEARVSPNPFVVEQAEQQVPLVPEVYSPKLDNARFERIAGHVGDWDDFTAAKAKYDAWHREAATRRDADLPPHPGLARALGQVPDAPPVAPTLPIHKIMEGRADKSRAYDPITAREEKTGLAVPLPHTKATPSDPDAVAAWYRANHELLASTGHRVMAQPDGSWVVARVLPHRQAEKAREIAEFVDSGEIHNLRTGERLKVRREDPTPEYGFRQAYDENLAEKDAAANGELRQQEVAAQEADVEFDADLDTLDEKLLRRREVGVGQVSVKSADGEKVFYPSAFEGHRGAMMKRLVSSKGAMEALSDGHGAGTSLFRRRAVGMKTYNPPKIDDLARKKGTAENRKALEYFDAWSNLVNSQIAHSPIWSKMLNGWSDQRVAGWLDNTPEGAAVRREMKHKYEDTELWVNEHRAKLDYYVPNKKIQRLLGKGRISTSQLRKEIHEDEYPDVFGADIEFLDKRSEVGQALGFVMDRAWHALGTAPIDTLSRHPFARAMYDMKMRSLVSQTDSKWLDPKTIDRFERESRKYAKEQVRRTLWDLTDQTNFADALRFIAPFWGAQIEAISKWARIISDRPETIGRWFVLGNAVNQNYKVVNEEGQVVHRDPYTYHPTDRVVVRVPEALRKTRLGKALDTIGSVGIPMGSANTVLQGEMPLLPGPGPMLTIPADKLMRFMSDTYMTELNENTVYRWLFPIGRPQHGGIRGVLDQVSPGWAKRVGQFSEGDQGIAYANLMTETAREMELENRRKGLPPPKPQEVEDQARWVWMLRIVTGMVAPVQMQFRPKHQFFIDEWHRYEKNYGIDAFDKFVKDYGTEMARYTSSSSNSTVGIPPTAKGMEEWAGNKRLIQQYPEWGDAIISPDAHSGEFDSDAYYAQFQINLGPGDDTPLRDSRSQTERFEDTDAKIGWQEYRKVDALLDVELDQRGLHSLQQVGAEDLAQAKQNFIADLTHRLPAWRAEYDNFNNDIYTRINELQSWAFNPDFDSRPDIKGVRQYLILRDRVATQLDSYAAATGGSRSLTSDENGALREWFYVQVGQLAQANPAFAEFYSRYLSGDTLEQGSGGF